MTTFISKCASINFVWKIIAKHLAVKKKLHIWNRELLIINQRFEFWVRREEKLKLKL